MFIGSIDKNYYDGSMLALSGMASRLRAAYDGNTYRAGLRYQKIIQLFQHGIVGCVARIWKYISNKKDTKILMKKKTPFSRDNMQLSAPNYFSNKRIAVYTCVFGNYDQLQEPICHPNNIDYYIITDLEVPDASSWSKIDLKPFHEKIEGFTNVERNRWFKMHPDQVFTDYNYSIYIDGNVMPVTDFTEFVNRIGSCGVAMYWHRYNNCVYQEALYNRYAVRKISTKELDEHVQYLKEQGMPREYGMTTCNVIARDHDNPICLKLMDDWWNEFMMHCRRDQMSFPYVAWKNNVNMNDIATLGSDVWSSDALIVLQH